MTKPSGRKPLSLKKATPETEDLPKPDVALPRKRSGKRVIRREQLAHHALGRTKAVVTPAKKKPKQAKSPVNKKPEIAPGELRLAALDKQLANTFASWRDYQPLALGIEKSLFRFIAEHHISASKRVVQKLLKRHTSAQPYLDNVLQETRRYELDGTPSGELSKLDKDYAQRQSDVAHSV